jgi:hypothetical protein
VFSKSYLPNYTDQTFTVDRHVPAASREFEEPDTFHLRNEEGQKVTGKFYAHELSRTKKPPDRTLIIQKVLKIRKTRGVKEFYVTFQGRPLEEAAWITIADLL